MFDQLSEKLTSAFRALGGRGRLSEANIAGAMREVRVALLQADVSLEVAREFVDAVKTRALGREVLGSLSPGQAVIAVVREELVRLMGEENDALNLAAAPPAGILLAGLQGAGKTTTAGKLARLLIKRERKRVLLASADVHRPAAAEQLRLLAEAAGGEFFAMENTGSGAVEIAAAARDAARAMSADVVLVDTAGRLHIDAEMMKELRGIHAALQPVETLFVADSMAGQDAVATARAFDRELALTGVVLTKTDGDARGGAALAIRRVTGKPIKFLGAGEGLDALEPFHPERVASRILGMGDVLTLVEEVEQKVGRERAEKAAAKIAKGRGFDLEDFREQLRQLENLGGLPALLEKLPMGMGAGMPKAALGEAAGKQAARNIAIINSMTPHERRFPAVLRGSRKKRIARGAGAQVQEVNRLLKQFLQMQKMMKRAGKKGGMQQMMAQLQRGGMPR
ncbi:MAG: signal recognition particle protein [Gammaproteobacteria bacterium]|nr:signal recognition particle protein [Gammaproteobacteria bacterium]MDA7962937.1 signal recognition particle protein [Gammaproteobacteria bacterium]MDA7972306.1 signal recognition particle protein [Gammaproteobacteria bacterium]MDA8024914.1 signal recognition particle protein [Gammaproteobacteria bacterium]